MDLEWFVIDAIPISDIDTDGLYALRDLNQTLAQRGVTMIIAWPKDRIPRLASSNWHLSA